MLAALLTEELLLACFPLLTLADELVELAFFLDVAVEDDATFTVRCG